MNTRIEGTPSARVAVIGGGIVATGLLGFYLLLQRRHERKVEVDRNSDTSKLSAWESRLMTKAEPNTEAHSMAALRQSFFDKRNPSASSVKVD